MEIIPIITLKNFQTMENLILLNDLSKSVKAEEKIYVLDLDGIEKNKINLDFYQKISQSYDLWVDCGPRNLGDVVDIFTSGANSITIRKNLFPTLNISDIKDLSENKIYLKVDYQFFEKPSFDDSILKEYDGFVNFYSKEEIEKNIILQEFIKKVNKQNKVYCYENNDKNYFFWENIGVAGLLVDINKLKGFKNGI